MQHNTTRRVVITGLGAVTPHGVGSETFWNATRHGVSSITSLPAEISSAIPIKVAGSVQNFVAEQHMDRKLINRTDRMTHFALAAIQEALHDSRLVLEQEDPQRVGAVIANTIGGMNFGLKQVHALYTKGPRFLSAYTAIAWLQTANAGQASILYGIQGYTKTPVNDAVGGLDAFAMAYQAVRRGAADVLLTGGCEALIHPFILLVMAHQGQCYLGNDPHGYRPFDRRASGLIMAEGAGICVVEEYEHALKRGASIYGEIVGSGQTNDALGLFDPSAHGTHYARSICQAVDEGALEPQEIAYMSLDGRALPDPDQGEAEALRLAFGPDLAHIPVSVPRTMIGHSYAAAGALDTITAVLALKHDLIPPTLNCEELDPRYAIDIVRAEARPLHRPGSERKPQAVLVCGRGIGGANVVLAVKKV